MKGGDGHRSGKVCVLETAEIPTGQEIADTGRERVVEGECLDSMHSLCTHSISIR